MKRFVYILAIFLLLPVLCSCAAPYESIDEAMRNNAVLRKNIIIDGVDASGRPREDGLSVRLA